MYISYGMAIDTFLRLKVSASSESMYDDAYTLQRVVPEDIHNFNYVAGMVPFLFNLIQDVCILSEKKIIHWHFRFQENKIDSIHYFPASNGTTIECQKDSWNHNCKSNIYCDVDLVKYSNLIRHACG